MVKLSTPVEVKNFPIHIGLEDKVMILGSCFADSMGKHLADAGFDVCLNPFGTVYNPLSILSSIERLASGNPFELSDCEEMGAGAGLICSFSHHTSFARATSEEFLSNANAALEAASAFWKACGKVIITLGTAWVWKHEGAVVSNCLKRPGGEFTHEMISTGEVCEAVRRIMEVAAGKEIIFTVSPIRHLSMGAHANQLSKSTLLLGLDAALEGCKGAACFPSYEIMLDELRDYRFYGEDLVHPSETAAQIIWERFRDSVIPSSCHLEIEANEKAARHSAHRKLR